MYLKIVVCNDFYCFFLQKLIRKDGDYHSSRMMDEKDVQANQNMQPKKKHKKSGSSNKVKEKVEVRIDFKTALLNICQDQF